MADTIAHFVLRCAQNLRYLRSLGVRDEEIEHPHGGLMGPLPKQLTIDRWVEVFGEEAQGRRNAPPEQPGPRAEARASSRSPTRNGPGGPMAIDCAELAEYVAVSVSRTYDTL